MRLPIDVLNAIVPHIRPIDTGNILGSAVAPIHKQRIALLPSRIGHIVGRKRKLVGIATHPCVCDFGRTLVRGPRSEDETKKQSYNEQKFALH